MSDENKEENVSFHIKDLFYILLAVIFVVALFLLVVKPALVKTEHSPTSVIENSTGNGNWRDLVK